MKPIALAGAGPAAALQAIIRRLAAVARAIAPPLLRIALAVPFLKSGLTKWDGFALAPTAAYLFEDEFKLHLFGHAYEIPFPDTLALVDGVAEIVLPALLIIGLATRLDAFGLLIMTGVIQLVVPDGWANFHLPWASIAVAIIALGPGPFSADWLLARAWSRARLGPSNAQKIHRR
jgi:putative oxidoreductase